MKITIISDMISPYMGGSERYVIELSKILIQRGHDVTWVGMRLPNTKKYEVSETGIKIRRLDLPFKEDFIQSRRLFCFNPKLFNVIKDADVIQWNSFVAAITGGIISKLRSKPHILLTHEMFQDLWKYFSSNKIEQLVYPFIEKLIVKNNYNAAIVPCNYTKNTLMKLGMKESKIKKIPHGLNLKHFKPAESIFRKKCNIENKYVIGWCGRFGFKGTAYSKNLTVLFDSFVKVKRKVPNAFMLFAGTDFDKIKWYLDKLNLTEFQDYEYLGQLDYDELPDYYSSLDVFASSSLSEGFGFTVAESQACGIPVVCFNAGSLPEVVSANKTGKVIKKQQTSSGLAKKIIELHKYPNLRKKLGKEGPNWVKQFTWEKSAKMHEKVYEDVYCYHKIMR